MNTNFPSEQPLLIWRASARPLHERSRAWYIIAGVAAASLLLYSFITKAWTFSLVIILGSLIYWYFHKHEPSHHTIVFWDQGLGFNDNFMPWDACTSFWFIKGDTYTELHIECKQNLQPEIVIQTGPVSVANIRAILSAHLPEEHDRKEHILDTISKICKI